MLQKEKSSTTSSKSATNSLPSSDPLQTSVQYIKGVGPRLASVFAHRDIGTVRDLLTFFPRAYEDRTRLSKVAELEEGKKSSIAVEILSSRKIRTRTGKSIMEVRVHDDSGSVTLKWFHALRGMENRFETGRKIVVTGTPKRYLSRVEIIHPEISWNAETDQTSADLGRVVPIYTEIEGVPTRALRKILFEAIAKYGHALRDDLPGSLRTKHGFPKYDQAVRDLHFPEGKDGEAQETIERLLNFDTPSHWRLIYEEFFKFEYLILKQRLHSEKEKALAFGNEGGHDAVQDLRKMLPFELTHGQSEAVKEVLEDLSKPHPMNRLIQGDVGSGKTAVAFLTAGCVLAEGGQAALMAPTEILAEQHFQNAVRLFGGRLNVALLTGKTPARQRAEIIQALQAGRPCLLIGTHALLEPDVQFKTLAFTMIDEQQRFGVEQRKILREKGSLAPHQLVLSATPIPRTLALTAYGDLSVTSIKELPKGRSPVQTQVFRGEARAKAHEAIREQLRQGRQAYFVYPLVNESEAEGFTQLKSAVQEAEHLQQEVFPEFKVGLLHGQMRADEKAKIMDAFKRGELQILVSTTVIEVGVDVPNATVMAIEHAERFGLSQLHQLRGRVGRGSHRAMCFLFAAPYAAETTNQRLEVLERTHDGFEIAEADLELRGPGEFLGTRQSGGLPFRVANLVRDREWLLKARDDAMELLSLDPELTMPEHLPLRRYYEREGNLQFERLKTS